MSGVSGVPYALNGEFRELFLPVSEALLVLVEHFVILFELVAHLDLDSADLVELCSLLVEFCLQSCEVFFFRFQCLCVG